MPPMFDEEDPPDVVEIDDSEDELAVASSPNDHDSRPALSETLRRKAGSARTEQDDETRLRQIRSSTSTTDTDGFGVALTGDDEEDTTSEGEDCDEYDADGLVHNVEEDDDDDDEFVLPMCSKRAGNIDIEFPVSTLISPRSISLNYQPDLCLSQEKDVVRALANLARGSQPNEQGKSSKKRKREDNWIEFDLEQFEIYNTCAHSPWRLRALNFLRVVQQSHDRMYFDGILSFGGSKHYVQRVPFSELQIGGYGLDGGTGTVRDQIWIRSKLNEGTNVYYHLRQPSGVYMRFFDPFLWVVDLCKHFIDFCGTMADNGRRVRLSHFKTRFSSWLNKAYPESQFPQVSRWREQFGRTDFRVAVVTHIDYLWKEMFNLNEELAGSLPIFDELRLPSQSKPKKNSFTHPPLTVTTPYVYESFKCLAIHKYMKLTSGVNTSAELGNATIMPQGRSSFITGPDPSMSLAETIRNIQPGDVISKMIDAYDPVWGKIKEKKDYYYGLVHRVRVPQQAHSPRVFDVAWMYSPEHTPCRQTGYPWPKELFFSTHCGCQKKNEDEIYEDEVMGVHSIEWFGGPETSADFFVRQTYISDERRWVQLNLNHIFCDTSRSEVPFSLFRDMIKPADVGLDTGRDYAVGDTVLAVLSKHDAISEPFEIDSMCTKGEKGRFRLRRLLRRKVVDSQASDAAANELVYTDQFVTLDEERVVGPCTVRVFSASEEIPTPYDRNGTGNFFYVTHRQLSDDVGSDLAVGSATKENSHLSYVPLEPHDRLSMRQGFDPGAACPKLRSLDLFCGCGNLGRGLEDSGVVESRWANDIWDCAVKTFMANVSSSHAVEPFLGSADVFLEQALQGKYSHQVPAPGEVDLISGGSPCQGFSKLTTDHTSVEQFKNRSMIASFASFIDLYRPKYGILENVPDLMTNDGSKNTPQNEDIFGGLVGCLVGLGYQLTVVLGNAWSFGAPQHRQRVFLLFAAPGVRLPEPPLPSHGNPATFGHKAIGRLGNGERIWEPDNLPTAFPAVSAEEATMDLRKGAADMIDGVVDICVPYPDHRLSINLTDGLRFKIVNIPTRPYGLNLGRARALGAISDAAVALFSKAQQTEGVKSRAFTRLKPTELFRTVCTSCNVADARSGKFLHWRDPRPMSILEVRRAQGIPDHEVLLGSPAEKWKLVGNAVARQPALAIGLAIREAWLGTLSDLDSKSAAAVSLTTTTTTTMTTTLTTTTTTTVTADVDGLSSSPGPAGPRSSPPAKLPLSTNLPFKQNRTFKTSVQTTVISRAGQAASASPEPALAIIGARASTGIAQDIGTGSGTASQTTGHKRMRAFSDVFDPASKQMRQEDELASDDYVIVID